MSNIISEKLIFINENFDTKEGLFEFIAKKAEEENRSKAWKETYEGLVERESTMSTGFVDGIAIPHTKHESVIEPTLMVIKSANGIPWETMDEKDVILAFSILVPAENEDNIHLKLLSKLSRKLMDDQFKETIINSTSEVEILSEINKVMEE
ncbi:MAG: PTS sugar transporter subunit IIA [Tissierellia bacterium]|nr:PTS sugar transporter subunit IIA [Tissierellia bacterium]